MDFSIAQAPLDYPLSLDADSQPTPPSNDADVMGQNTIRHRREITAPLRLVVIQF